MAVQLDETRPDGASALAALETELLLEGLYQFYGDDLRGYDRAELQARLTDFLERNDYRAISTLQGDLLRSKSVRNALLLNLCTQDVALFDHPGQFAGMRSLLGPLLRSYPAPKIWIAECTSPSDVFALAILLRELEVHEKSHIYATASSEPLLQQAREGIFSAECEAQYATNYSASGGHKDFSAFRTVSGENARFADFLREGITWAHHNLVTDSSFNEFQLIVCRTPMLHFGAALRQRALSLFDDSLVHFGMLALAPEFRIESTPLAASFRKFPDHPGLYRHIR